MQAGNQTDFDAIANQLPESIRQLLQESTRPDDRRADARHPFFVPIRLAFMNDPTREFSCFARDISVGGVGMLHCMEIQPGEVVLTIPSEGCEEVRIRAEIVWCKPCGEGWYVSGARFVELLG